MAYNYATTMAAAFAGMLVDMEPKSIISRANEDDELLGFGKAVFQGDTDRGVTVTQTAEEFVGITIVDRSAYVETDNDREGFRKGDMARVLRIGNVWVEVAGAVAPLDPVHVMPDGRFANAGGIELPGCVFQSTADAAGALAVVRITK